MHSFRMLLQELLRPQCKAHILLASLKIPTYFSFSFLQLLTMLAECSAQVLHPNPLRSFKIKPEAFTW